MNSDNPKELDLEAAGNSEIIEASASKELTPAASTEVAATDPTQIDRMFAQIMELSKDPNAAANITALGELQMKMMDYRKEEQFNTDKVAAIIAMPKIRRDGAIVIEGKNGASDRIQGRFVKYESLQKVIGPILADHNLVLTHNVDEADKGGVTVQPVLTHRNGYVEKGGKMPLPFDTSGGKNNTQGSGSSVSYGKRYTACAALNIKIEGEDNDGLGGTGVPEEQLSTAKRDLVELGRAAANQGTEHYRQWFQNLSASEKGWLSMEPYHEQNKQAAQAADG